MIRDEKGRFTTSGTETKEVNLEEQIKWYDTFLYYSDLFPNESIEYVIKRTNARVYGDKNKQ